MRPTARRAAPMVLAAPTPWDLARWPFTCLLMLAIVTGFGTACAGWARVPLGATPIPAYKQYQVWTRDTMLVLKAVRIEHDSLTGVSLDQGSECRECRLTLPMAAVDSVREGETTNIDTTAIGVVAGMIGALFLIASTIPKD